MPIPIWRRIALVLCLVLTATSALPALAQSRSEEKEEEKRKGIISRRQYQEEADRARYSEMAHEALQEQISKAKELLRNESYVVDESLKAELLMRLAVAYEEMAKYEWAMEMDTYDTTLEACFDEGRDDCDESIQLDRTRSSQYNKKAVSSYQNLLANYQNFNRLDEVLFRMAVTLEELGERKEALQTYTKLVKQYQTSRYVPDSYNAIGEYYFDNNNAYKALQAYKKAAAFRDSDIYTFALYKLGWCYYNVGEFDTAIETMKTVISETDRLIESGASVGISLKEEALKDLVQFFSEEGNLEEAKEYFTRYGQKKYYRKMLQRLAVIYYEQGKNELTIQTYKTLIHEEPMAPDNPEYQDSIIKSYWERDRFEEANREIDAMMEMFGHSSRWAQANADNTAALEEADNLIERNLRKAAVDSFQQAIKRKSKELLLLAEIEYKKYLDYFPESKKAYEMRFWYGEVLYKLKKYDLSAEQYEIVVGMDPNGKYLKDAASNTIFSIEKYIGRKQDEWDREAKAQRAAMERETDPTLRYAAIELNEWEKRLITACDTYARTLPNEENTYQVLYKAAYLLDTRNHFQDANQRYLEIVRAKPRTETAQFAVHRMLSSYEAIEDWENLNKVAREFHQNPDVGKSEKFKKELFVIFQNATVKLAEVKAKEAVEMNDPSKFAEAADAYYGFFEEFPDAKISPLALYNSALFQYKAGNKAKSIELRHQFVDTFPDELKDKEMAERRLYQKSVSVLAEHYDVLTDFDTAVEYFHILYERDPEFGTREGEDGFLTADLALQRAARYQLAMGLYDEAAVDYHKWIEAHPEDETVPGILLRIAEAYLKAEQYDKAIDAYKDVYSDKRTVKLDPDMVVYSRKMHGEILMRQGKESDARKVWEKAVAEYNRIAKSGATLKRAPVDAAEMRFYLLQPEFDAFDSMTISSDEKQGRQDLKEKTAKMDRLKEKYLEMAKDENAGAWSIAAAYMAGRVVLDLYDDLMGAECPPTLDEDQCDMYLQGLQIVAYERYLFPTLDAYREVLTSAAEVNVYNEYTVKAMDKLGELAPEEFPPTVEQMPETDFITSIWTTMDYAQ